MTIPWPVKPIAHTDGALTLLTPHSTVVGTVGIARRDPKIRDLRIFDPARRPVGIDPRHISARGKRFDQADGPPSRRSCWPPRMIGS